MISNNCFLNLFYLIIPILLLINLTNCGIYSFSGTSIPNDAKTICVYYINNSAALVEPNLSSNLSEDLKTKCLTETNLTWKEENPDISFAGTIKSYKIEPIAIQNNETAAKNRLTITVQITYTNKIDDSQNFNKQFTHYADFDSSKNFYEEEEELNTIIINNLVDDIFNTALVNW